MGIERLLKKKEKMAAPHLAWIGDWDSGRFSFV
jgi:hypothetical protein